MAQVVGRKSSTQNKGTQLSKSEVMEAHACMQTSLAKSTDKNREHERGRLMSRLVTLMTL